MHSSANIRTSARTSSRPPPPIGVVVPAHDPMKRVMGLGVERHAMVWLLVIGLAIGLHGTAVARIAVIDVELLRWVQTMRLAINEHLASTYDIDVEKPPEPQKEEPKEEPKDEPKPEPKAAPPPPSKDEPTPPPPPPAAAQAGAVLTQQPDDQPIDFANTFVTGSGSTFAGGQTQQNGTSTTAVYDRHAQAGGQPGGSGAAPAPPAPVGPDRSRVLSVRDTEFQDCRFPSEADSEQIDEMRVPVEITVNAQGRVLAVKVLKDPGFGFAREAKTCVQRQSPSAYNVALDHDGNAITATRAVTVHFTR